jgi:arylsulfatase
MKRRKFIKTGFITGASVSLTVHAAKTSTFEGTNPNIIIVMPDDISWGSMSLYKGELQTPALDSLFKMGTVLTNFHVSPTCAPSRASLMTGRHEFYSGVTHTIFMRDCLNKNIKIMPEVLKECGYTTALIGKWHLGDEKELRPYQRGFDEVLQHGGGGIGQCYPHSSDFPENDYNNPTLLHNEKVIKTKGYCTDIFFDHAIDWMKKQTKPFFTYIPTNVVHGPQTPPEGSPENLSQKEAKNIIMKNFDDNMGKLTSFLSESGLDKNTLLIYYTDNGSSDARIYGLTGGKGKASEGGLRVPCVFYWKGMIEKQKDVEYLSGHIDLLPTLAALVGYKGKDIGGNKPWDGKNLLPVFEGKVIKDNRYFIGHRARWRNGTADKSQYKEASIQDERYKLYFKNEDSYALYDLINDLGEKNDLKDKKSGEVKRLKNVFDEFWTDARQHMINEDNYKSVEVSRPFWDLYKDEYGEKAFEEASTRTLKKWEDRKKKNRKRNKKNKKK